MTTVTVGPCVCATSSPVVLIVQAAPREPVLLWRPVPRPPVAAPRRPAVVVPAEPPRGAGWCTSLRAFSGR